MEYQYHEINHMIKNLSCFFDVVRLVDPIHCHRIEVDQGITRKQKKCYEVWNKSDRCENCISYQAYQQQKRLTKFELLNDEIYFVISTPLQIRLADDSLYSCVLEMVVKNSNKILMGHLKNNDYFENIILYEKKLYEDALTQVYNRRFYAEKSFCYGYYNDRHEIIFIVTDLKGFKQINDQYGHIVGDTILYETAQLISRTIRKQDYVIRMGGDEFLIILDHSDEEGARRVIDEIKEKSCHELIYDHVEKKHVILNFGMAYDADFDGSDESIKKLYYEADQNMYHDKKINLK
ncbi:MAG: GGDEF domain-containing protein [Longibaculum muris]|uniref:Diguanylate cyclase (GGDEF)-like protein n=1 Tax=Longibaculum muris TaxID=1796628 RepID=A0A4R3YLE4_9FIRM|nr:GGDEF domain-containing protein [Longibaculum muris]MBS5370269.1 GGDEF domain-containing protein [Coprobacillus cateniformis]MCR1889017.1 GGDEF domain-containing protein [Longibaculum muris]MED9811155.1 GGDEF domain-containing protein [Longibaculum muris]TCV93605.1 diguanylate cyclase (GGDEF)-like protein [Longibaculum muris]